LTITEPTASSTGTGAKFSEAMRFTQRRCLTVDINIQQTKTTEILVISGYFLDSTVCLLFFFTEIVEMLHLMRFGVRFTKVEA
jgi:hypothetical protein